MQIKPLEAAPTSAETPDERMRRRNNFTVVPILLVCDICTVSLDRKLPQLDSGAICEVGGREGHYG